VRIIGGDREPAVRELGGHASAGTPLEVAELVLDWQEQRVRGSRELDRRVAAAVRPDLAVVCDRFRLGRVGWASHTASVSDGGKGAMATG
jgi:hypothetical protein